MSFILLLTLSLSTLSQVELASATHDQQRQDARENARLGLLIALGKLQQSAGPDQRVTARADILGDNHYADGNQYWTGVWNTTNINAAPVWLVSGETDVTAEFLSGESLVKASASVIDGHTKAAIRVPKIEINENGVHVGNYAFWISGENDKIALSALERIHDFPTTKTERRYLEFQNGAPDLNYLSGEGYSTPETDNFNLEADPALSNRLDVAFSNNQLTALELSSGQPAFPEWRADSFSHNATAASWTVLANSNHGGLKANLLDETLNDPMATRATRDFLSGYPDPLLAAPGNAPPLRKEGEPYFAPQTIPTEIVLWMGIFHTWKDAQLRIRFHVEAEFWNPYTLPLIYPPDPDPMHDRAFVVRFENLPTITIRQATKKRVAPTITEDLNDLSAYPTPNDPRKGISSWIDIAPIDLEDRPQLEPGEVYRVMEPNPMVQTEGLARDFGTQLWAEEYDTRPPDNAKIEIKAKHPKDGVRIIIEDYLSGQPVFTIENLKFDDFTIKKTFRKTNSSDAADSFSRPESLTYSVEDYTIAYHFRLATDESDPGVLKELLDGLDLQHPVLDAGATFTDHEGVTYKVSDFIDSASTDPADAAQLKANTFSLLDIYRDATTRSHKLSERVLAYDLPRDDSDFVSLGALRYLPRWKKASTTMGMPHSDANNDIFDRFFVEDSNKSNPHLAYLDATGSPDLAEVASSALVKGGFNVNSTSVAAWATFLSSRGLIETTSGDEEYARNLFTRLPYYSAANPRIEISTTKLETTPFYFPPVYQQGMRQLDSAKAKDQLLFIAKGIVTHLKTRGKPYKSVQEFLDAGIIQDLLESPETADGGGINANIMKNSNVYITQGDIAAQRAELLTARSDTFLIRSFGDAVDPYTNEVAARAWIEAIVRRKPTLITEAAPHLNATALNPRKFEIVSWRWLDKSEVQ
ncbi:hypothetical protein GCM10007047_21040 [Cerasicoccus arenae]|uniref:Uncharacterized protein n=2 Tax=Cerasicoccus arenae TaxID=424488 RepID=A0A8J3DAZ2_9BACT|nr:hypothetical protein GCM10007047_21040 [Cerasicoccus arenae]